MCLCADLHLRLASVIQIELCSFSFQLFIFNNYTIEQEKETLNLLAMGSVPVQVDFFSILLFSEFHFLYSFLNRFIASVCEMQLQLCIKDCEGTIWFHFIVTQA